MATIKQAINLCKIIEEIAPKYGCHVALTGGTLYKGGERKDIDILFYRVRQVEKINDDGLFSALDKIGVKKVSGFGWCHKAVWDGHNIDIFFPEADDGVYGEQDNTVEPVVHPLPIV